ncbi:amidohydrolase [Cupriavidus metallidurans]|uniref:amidohydrolase n=1 Tax=Cupriavidus metallidurans TaxID=119219 RepID=UPI001CCD0487|nr:amidohydrolase [Cupriavidus metallidurans]UBM07667.1 amidohydrolase [Cupriavidus metallidurans]
MGATRGLLVLHNGQIHTFDARHPRAHAIALRNGSVVALDDAAMALAQQAEAVRDLQGACVIPGFNDTHAHMEREGLKTLRPSLAQARSVADVLNVVRERARLTPKGQYIVTMPVGTPPYYFGGPAQLREARMPTREELDAAAPDHPVYIPAHFGNWGKPPGRAALNSLALRRNGLTPASQPRCAGVEIGLDAQGQLNGEIVEHNNRPTIEFDLLPDVPRFGFAERIQGLHISQRLYHAQGVTSIYEGHGSAPETISVYRRLWEEGELTMRTSLVVSPTWDNLTEAARAMRDWLAVARGRGLGDPWLRVSGVHLAYGGDAAVACCARQDLPNTGWSGFVEQAVTPADYRALCFLAAEHDLRVNTIVGDRLHEIVPVLREVDARFPLNGRRWVMQHIARARREDLLVLKSLGILATTISTYCLWKGGSAYLDETDGGNAVVPHATFEELGLPYSLATDNIPYQPFFTLWVAARRQERVSGRAIGPGQALSLQQGLAAFTVAGARLTFDEDWKGPLYPGYAADLAVLSDDPFSQEPEEWKRLHSTLTIVGGRVVHEAEAA